MRRSPDDPYDYALLVISDSDQDWHNLKTNHLASECVAWTWANGSVTTKIDECGMFLSEAKIVFIEAWDPTIIASFERSDRRRFVLIHKSQKTSFSRINSDVKFFEHRSKDAIWKHLKPILNQLAEDQVPNRDWMALLPIVDDLEVRVLNAARRHFFELFKLQGLQEHEISQSLAEIMPKLNLPMVEAYEAAVSVIPNAILDNWYQSLEDEMLRLSTCNLSKIRNLWYGDQDNDVVGLIQMIRAKING